MNKLFVAFAFIYVCGQIISFAVSGVSALAATSLTTSLPKAEVSLANVTSTSGFLATDFFIVGGEIVCYDALTSNTFVGLTRGCKGTSIKDHKAGRRIFNETTGVINESVGYNLGETVTTAGPFSVLLALPGLLKTTLPRLISWDYPFLQGSLYGFPMIYFQYIGITVSTGLILTFVWMFSTTAMSILRRP